MPVMDPSLEAYLMRNDSDDEQTYRSNDISGLGQENAEQLRKRLGLFDPEDEDEENASVSVRNSKNRLLFCNAFNIVRLSRKHSLHT